MIVSYRWLASFFPPGGLDLEPHELARRLTFQGLAVDEVRDAFPAFSGVVLGQVRAAEPHPHADRLTLCTVASGDGERRVVCGAPNVEVGAFYGYATEGARLPGDRRIRRSRIRGVESEGMLCSAPELGLDALGAPEGIWPVPGVDEHDLGRDLREALALDDVLLVLDVPSNRGDVLSHLGIARELQVIVGSPCALPPAEPPREAGEGGTAVEIRDREGCPLYLARRIDGVSVAPSPGWLQVRLLAAGQRPVNNVVDATNHAMLECGQPLHPFDFDRLAGGRIVVRRAAAGERFVTLDGRERELDPDTTMISDAERAVAIGGIMGGLESEVTPATIRVLLESAHFDPLWVARAARRLGLPSEASTRFARGVDPALAAVALDRAAAMIAGLAGGSVRPRVGDGEPPASRPPLRLRRARLEALVGRRFAAAEPRQALEAVGIRVLREEAAELEAAVPGWRFDLAREVDLVEEVARLTGYDAVPPAPLPAPAVAPAPTAEERGEARLRTALEGAGFDEARTPSFVGEGVLGPPAPLDILVEIRNPISKSDRFLRPFLFAPLGEAVARNLRRGAPRAKLYEIGRTFVQAGGDGGLDEGSRVGLAAAGERAPLDWSGVLAGPYDLFDLTGDLTDALGRAGGIVPRFEAGRRAYLHPGRQAEIRDGEGRAIGFCGEVHPRLAGTWGTDARVYVAELDLAALVAPVPQRGVAEVPREPAIVRDLALVVPDRTRAADVIEVVRELAEGPLATAEVFDRYRGAQLEPGTVSLGVRLRFQATRTLTDAEVEEIVERLIARLAADHGWRLR